MRASRAARRHGVLVVLLAVVGGGLANIAGAASAKTADVINPPVFVTKWGSLGTGDGQFNLPTGVAVDGSGNVYVADRNNHRIEKFDSSGGFLTRWGSVGSGDGQFFQPSGLTVDGSGNIYVADTGNHRIQKFDSSGSFLTKWGLFGSGNGQFANPFGVAVDGSGSVYVADTFNSRIQKFDSSGNFLAKWGSSGSGDGQFNGPYRLAADSSGNVYVADYLNNRIQKFDSAGNFLAKWGSSGSGDGEFSLPFGVAVGTGGHVYVADLVNARIQVFDNSGGFLTKWGSSGSGDGQFDQPSGLTADSSGNVYVADANNNRIQKFGPSAAPTLVSIAVTPANPTITTGSDQQFTATGTYSDTSTADLTSSVTWDSATTDVATIGTDGLAHGVTAGQSTITATLGAISGSTTLTVTVAEPTLESIAVTPTNPTISTDGDQQFTATGTYSDTSTADLTDTVTWDSATPSVATITNGGLGHGVGQGTSTISATLGAVSGSTMLTVTGTTLPPDCTKGWGAAEDGLWSDASAWTPAGVPTSTDDVCIAASGSYTVTLNGSQSANSVTLGASGNAQQPTLRIADSVAGPATLTSATGFTNHGNVAFDTATGYGATLALTTGAFTNATDGNFTLNGGVAATIAGQVVNNGTFTVPVGTFLNMAGSAPSFDQNGGTLDVTGSFPFSGTTLTYNGGSIASPLVLTGATIELAASPASPDTLVLNGANTLTGNVRAGHTLKIADSVGGPSTLTSATGFTNHGSIVLDTTTGYGATLAITTGAFTNATDGNLTVNGAVPATIAGQAVNHGTFTLPGSFGAAMLNLIHGYTQSSEAVLDVEIAGPSNPGVPAMGVGDTASLAGALNIHFANGFAPTAGQTFTILTYQSQTGAFTVELPDGVDGSIAYGATAAVLAIGGGSPTLTSIAVTPANPTITTGSDQQFAATGTYSDMSTADVTDSVTWDSATPSVGTITTGGLAHAVSSGTSTISATLGAVSGSTTLTVTAPTLHSIAVTPANPTITSGADQQFTATGSYSDDSTADLTGSVTWGSATPSVATISANGLAYAVGPGQSTISATLGSVSGSTTLTVAAPTLVSIAVTPANPTITSGADQQFTATGSYSDDSTADLTGSVTWDSATPSVATISAGGLAHGVAQGTSLISATLGAVSGSTTLTVSAPTLVSIAVTPANPTVAVGSDQQFTATGSYSDDSTADLSGSVTWDSATPSVATISANGLAHGVGQGTSMISATLGTVTGSTTLTVSAPTLVSIAVTPANPTITTGADQQFTATGTYSDSTTADLTSTLTWASGTTSVATITNNGLAHAVGPGQSTISATLGTVSGSTTLTVTPAGLPVPVLTYTGPSSASPQASITLTATLTTASGSPLSGRTITFTLNGVTFSAKTNRSGVVRWRTKAPTVEGSYPIGIAFAGDASYGPVAVAPNLSVAKIVTALSYSGSTSASTRSSITLRATLTTATGAAVSRKTVTFTLNGVVLSAKTNSSGVVSVKTRAPTTAGSYPIGIAFAGDATYDACAATATLTIG